MARGRPELPPSRVPGCHACSPVEDQNRAASLSSRAHRPATTTRLPRAATPCGVVESSGSLNPPNSCQSNAGGGGVLDTGVAFALGGQPQVGLGAFGVTAAYAVLLVLFGGRSETMGVLRGTPTDERLASFNLAATAAAGTVAIIVALAGFLWQVAPGESATQFVLVAAAAGVSYLAALLWFRWRR